MDVTIQYPWLRRPFMPGYFPGRMYEQYFGEHVPDGDLFSPFLSMFCNRPFYVRGWMDSGFSEVGTHAGHWSRAVGVGTGSIPSKPDTGTAVESLQILYTSGLFP